MKNVQPHDALTLALLGEIEKFPVIDAHEHLWTEKERLGFEVDVFSLLTPFLQEVLVNAGAPCVLNSLWSLEPVHGHPRRPQVSPTELWQAVEPHWDAVRQTSHAQSFRHTLRLLFGVDELTSATYKEVSAKIAAHSQPGLHKQVLEDTCGIKRYIGVKSINRDQILPPEGVGRWVMHMWPFACWSSTSEVDQLEKDIGVRVQSLDDADAALLSTMEKAKRAGYVGIKTNRNAAHPITKVDKATAAAIFAKVLRTPPSAPLRQMELQPLWDYCLYQLFEAARLNDLTVAAHTTGFPTNCLCSNLVEAAKDFPDVRFDLYHGSLPMTREIGLMARAFPNVYLNMCWMPAVSRTMAVSALNEWLDLVPSNKIIGFGGDCFYVENVVGELAMARRVIAEALAGRVHAGLMDEEEALATAKRLLFDNAAAIYRLDID